MNEVNLVSSLLQAIVNIDGDALVMHAGDKPYVVSPSGQVELASRGLTLDAVTGIVAQLLPVEFQNALDEFGAVQYALPRQTEFPREQFTVVVARGYSRASGLTSLEMEHTTSPSTSRTNSLRATSWTGFR